MSSLTLRVPDMSCDHCAASVSSAVGAVLGVRDVKVDLDTKQVEVEGESLDRTPIEQAIRAAGYEPKAR